MRSDPDLRRIRRTVLLKSAREQPKELFARALWQAIEAIATENRYEDGVVEWFMMENEVRGLLSDLDEQARRG